MGKFSASVRNLAKKDNAPAATRAKVDIRRRVLAAIGPQARVFDAFAGEGAMYRAVWHEAAGYVGCDTRFFRDDRACFVADNRRVLRCLDLKGFAIFDLDAYGSPWEPALIIATRRRLQPGERCGLILTEGQSMKLRMGGMSAALAQLAGVSGRQSGLGRVQGELIDRALLRVAALMGARIATRWQAVSASASRMVYLGLVLEGRT